MLNARNPMDHQSRRALFVMLGIMAFQAWGLIAMLGHASSAQLLNVFAFNSQSWAGWLVAASVGLLFVGLTLRSLPYVRERFLDVTPLKILAIPFALGAGAVEELLFRRLLMDWLYRNGHSEVVQIATSAIVFGVLHASFGIFSGSWRGIISPVIWTTFLGLGLAIAYVIANRDVAPCIWSHAMVDLCIEPWLIIAVMKKAENGRSPAR